MPGVKDYPWVLDDNRDLSVILDQAYDVIIDYQMITDTNGQEILNFNLPLDDPKAEQCGNEDVLQTGGSEFTVRTVTDGWDDNGEQCFQIYAEARWYELAEYDPIQPFSLTNVGPEAVMQQFLSTTDWTIGTIDITTTSDFSITQLTNPLAGIRMLPAIFGGELYFDNINKKVHLLQRIGTDTDFLYAYGKNLKKNQRIIDTRYLVTRFRPIGKDGLTIASVNNGLDYLENYQWFDTIGKKRKVICDSATNDNITDPTALMEWGQGIVDANSIPRITYYMDVVIDKNDGIPGMGDTVRVYDSLLKMNLTSRVAQRSYNVLQPELSTMQLSTALYTLSDQLNNSVSVMSSKIDYLNTETATVKQEVVNAQSTADGKNTVFYGENEPDASTAKTNDIRFQYINGTLSKMYRFDGTQWQLISSIIPGDAVIGGTIDFANVTAINIDAGSISTGTLKAIIINGSNITSEVSGKNDNINLNGGSFIATAYNAPIDDGFTDSNGGRVVTTINPTTFKRYTSPETASPTYNVDYTWEITPTTMDFFATRNNYSNSGGITIDVSTTVPTIKATPSPGVNPIGKWQIADLSQITFSNAGYLQTSDYGGAQLTDPASGQTLYLQPGQLGAAVISSDNVRLVLYSTGSTARLETLTGGAVNLIVGTVNGSSDRSKKKNIVPFSNTALDKIKNTKVYNYNFINDDDKTPVRLGVMAQEAPTDIVGVEGNTVDLYAMISLVWKAIQELSDRIDQSNVKKGA
jgi:phage minor structural protein